MSSSLRILLPLLLIGALVTPAAGEEDPEPPAYFVEHLVPSDEQVPEGWKIVDEAAPGPGLLTAADVNDLAASLELEDGFFLEYRVFKGRGELVPVAMMDVEEKVSAFHAALTEKAAAKGWRIRELGSPTRVMVVGSSSSSAAKLAEALVEHCVYALTEIAMNRLRGHSGQEEAGREAALEYTKAVDAMVPKTGTAQAVIGVVHWIKAQPKEQGQEPDRKEQELAVKHFARSLEADVKYPPKGSVLVFAAGQLGGMLLTWKDKSRLEEATKALELAVKNEREAKTQAQRFGNRYNLACAYARKGRKDDAFKNLEVALEVGKNMPVSYFRAQYENIREKDEDMAPLRSDPRFSELMKRFKPPEEKKRRMPPPTGRPDDPHHPPKKPDDPHHPDDPDGE